MATILFKKNKNKVEKDSIDVIACELWNVQYRSRHYANPFGKGLAGDWNTVFCEATNFHPMESGYCSDLVPALVALSAVACENYEDVSQCVAEFKPYINLAYELQNKGYEFYKV